MSVPEAAPNRPSSLVWLLPVVPRLEPISPEIDRLLGRAARAAIAGDASARDALFTAFQPRFERSIRRCQRLWDGQSRGGIEDAIEMDDIAQEAYIVFVDLLQTWPGGDSVSAFLCARFPWRLNDTIRSWRRRRAAVSPLVVVETGKRTDDLTALIDEIAADLQPGAHEMLCWRVIDRLTFAEIAQRLGVSKRTVNRRWDELVSDLSAAERWHARRR
jgi:RNA polymerase sigma factor (sigma-70 family)